jgi:hypothetical protein
MHRSELLHRLLLQRAGEARYLRGRGRQGRLRSSGPGLPNLHWTGAMPERAVRLRAHNLRRAGPQLRHGVRWVRWHPGVRHVPGWGHPELPQWRLCKLPGHVPGCSGLCEPRKRKHGVLRQRPACLRPRLLRPKRGLRLGKPSLHSKHHQRRPGDPPESDHDDGELVWRAGNVRLLARVLTAGKAARAGRREGSPTVGLVTGVLPKRVRVVSDRCQSAPL